MLNHLVSGILLRFIARGNNIQHIQNGEVVVEYTIGSERMAALIADSKWPGINEIGATLRWKESSDFRIMAMMFGSVILRLKSLSRVEE